PHGHPPAAPGAGPGPGPGQGQGQGQGHGRHRGTQSPGHPNIPWDPRTPPWDPQSAPGALRPPSTPRDPQSDPFLKPQHPHRALLTGSSPRPQIRPGAPQSPLWSPPAPLYPPVSQTPQDYEAVPVGQFGLAMLRGMGWTQGQGIGRTFPRVVPPLEQRPRPRGLGLGAEAAPPGTPKAGEPPQGPAVGDSVAIEAGPHRGLRGKVSASGNQGLGGSDPWGGSVPLLGRGSDPLGVPCGVCAPFGGLHGCGGAEFGGPHHSGGVPAPHPPIPQRPPCPPRSAKQPRGAPHWLRRDLRVRCVDRAFRGGLFYNCKVRPQNTPKTPQKYTKNTPKIPPKPPPGPSGGGLREASLETVVPRGSAERVMVVLGEHLGRILERDALRGRALVQLGRAGPAVLPLPFDSICHYLGGGEDD
uniref:G-patch domain and KOW motifs-containing protein n=1 Tax=Geospiza parvula TaxID=87175 RepID=A0A8C3NC65_GEOPR